MKILLQVKLLLLICCCMLITQPTQAQWLKKIIAGISSAWQPVWGEYSEGSNTNRNLIMHMSVNIN